MGHSVVALELCDILRSSIAVLSSTAIKAHNISAVRLIWRKQSNQSKPTQTSPQIIHTSKTQVSTSSRHHASAFGKANRCVQLSSKIVWKCLVQTEMAASAPLSTFVSRQFANNTCAAYALSTHGMRLGRGKVGERRRKRRVDTGLHHEELHTVARTIPCQWSKRAIAVHSVPWLPSRSRGPVHRHVKG